MKLSKTEKQYLLAVMALNLDVVMMEGEYGLFLQGLSRKYKIKKGEVKSIAWDTWNKLRKEVLL